MTKEINIWQDELAGIKKDINELYETLEYRLDVKNEAQLLIKEREWEVLSHLTHPFLILDMLRDRIAGLAKVEEKPKAYLTAHKSNKEVN